MKHLCKARGWWKMIIGEDVLTETASEDEKAKYEEKSEQCLYELITKIDYAYMHLVTSCERPEDVWNALTRFFEKNTLANKLYLKKEYYRKEMSEETPLDEHFKDMKELTDKLAALGASINEEDQIITLLGSMPKSYSTIVNVLENKESLNLIGVQEALKNEERKIKKIFSSDENILTMRKRSTTYQTSRSIICYNCRKEGHIQRNCPHLRSRTFFKNRRYIKSPEILNNTETKEEFETFGTTQPEEINPKMLRHGFRTQSAKTNYQMLGLGARSVDANHRKEFDVCTRSADTFYKDDDEYPF